MRIRLLGVLLAAVMVGVVAACGGDDDAQGDAISSLCSDLATLATASAQLDALDPITATKGDYQDAADEVKSALSDVVDDAKDLDEANTDALQSAVDAVGSAVDDVPDDASIQEAIQSIAPQIQAIGMEIDNIETQNCAEAG